MASLREHTRFAIDAFERLREGAGRIDHLSPAEYSRHDISAELMRDEAAGWAMWSSGTCGRTGNGSRRA